jgi:leucyl aminopeptidase
MNNLLIANNTGTPLFIIEQKAYQNWLNEQTQTIQNWLKNTAFSEKGLALLPNEKGELVKALFVVNNVNDYFACGELIKLLPQGQYLLKADKEHHSAICFGWLIGSYQFNQYFSTNTQQSFPVLALDDQALIESTIKYVQATALTRDLINTPAADMMPEHLAQATQHLADEFGARVNNIIGDELLEQNYPTIHAVGRASVHKPRLIDLTWGDKSHPQITLVGKGVCFDSGGLDIKPAAGMRNMKKDMGGSAHVLGLAHLIMANNLPVNLRVMIPAVENAVSSNALRPGDIVTTRKGITVEIHNTDAEGRLVLCDALAEANNDKPELVIDFATLTGAMRVALGTELPGFFSTNDQIAADITSAGSKISDPVWRMPLHNAYDDLLKSTIADMTNCPSVPFGGAITAALYLDKFVDDNIDWLHFDIMGFNIRNLSGRPIGGEAFGIRAVFDYLQQRYN